MAKKNKLCDVEALLLSKKSYYAYPGIYFHWVIHPEYKKSVFQLLLLCKKVRKNSQYGVFLARVQDDS